MKRTIEEVVTLYELEPITRKDIYVEGESDRELMCWCFEMSGQRHRSAYPIDLIDVSTEIVAQYSLNAGSNRSRVIAMALEVWKEINKDDCELTFLVDKDLSHFVMEQVPPCGVLSTDYAAMDAYLLQGDALSRYARFVCRVGVDQVHDFIDSFFQVSIWIFSMRLALNRLGIAARLVGVDRVLLFVNGRVSVDRIEIIRRTLSVANELRRFDDVVQSVEVAFKEITEIAGDRRFFVHGHDLMLLLGEAAFKFGKDPAYREEARVRKSLLMALHYDELAIEPMFSKLFAT